MTKIINNIILASVFIVPMASIIPIHGTIVWYPQLLALMSLGLVCLAMLWWDRNKFISIFLIYAIFSYLFVCSQSPRSMLCLITGYSGIVFSYFVSKTSGSKIYTALAWICIANTVFLILQIFKLDPLFSSETGLLLDRTVGFMGSRNQLGVFHTTIPLLLTFISPWLLFLAIPIFVIKCSTAFVGVCAGVNSFLFFNGRTKLATILFVVILISSFWWVKFGNKSQEIGERFELWKLSISQTIQGKLIVDDNGQVVRANPLFGYGIGNFFVFSPHSQSKIIRAKATHRYEHAHNDIVEAFFEFGYIGIFLILLCIGNIFMEFFKCLHIGHPNTKNLNITFCSLIAISVCSLGVYVFHAPVSLFIFCLVLGLFYREVDNAKQSKIA